VDDVRIGARVRVVRHRLGWRQRDVAERADVSQDTVSRIERGQLGALQLRTIRAVLGALEIELASSVWWRAGDLDRLADEGHAALCGRVAELLVAAGWTVRPEVSFSVYGERGSIDVLAWHPVARILLVVEVKTTLNSVEEALRRHDSKVRLAPAVARERFGWDAVRVSRLLVLPDLSTPRRRAARVDAVLGQVYPLRGREAARWVRCPAGSAGLLMFLSPTLGRRRGRGPIAAKRVQTPPASAPGRTDAPPAQVAGSSGDSPVDAQPAAPKTPGERR
jgi:transcriptional regulator with XRE-family HTH domain